MKTIDLSTNNETMMTGSIASARLPDVTSRVIPEVSGALDWVGMQAMEFPILLPFEGKQFLSMAFVDGFVSLDDPEAKGIHMSRLYKLCWEAFDSGQVLSVDLLKDLASKMVSSQQALSKSAQLKIKTTWPLQRAALKSDLKGFRGYPVELNLVQTPKGLSFSVSLEVMYSSTCPCSAALSRQLNAEHFFNNFGDKDSFSKKELLDWFASEDSVKATPHAQRSIAVVELLFDKSFRMGQIEDEINRIESSLATAVQTAVKREDEQEFARLNAENLMFCEDAARKIKLTLDQRQDVLDFSIKVNHQESLHPHDAVAYASKKPSK